jgi:hypothetical protein
MTDIRDICARCGHFRFWHSSRGCKRLGIERGVAAKHCRCPGFVEPTPAS